MKTKYIDVKGKWGIVLCYHLLRRDVHEMRALMESVGMEDESIDEALRILLYHKNKGMCVTNTELGMSLVFVGEATCEDQWWDTMAHEVLDHAKTAICDFYHVSLRGEESAWLTGYLMRKVVQLVAPPCA